MLGPIMAQIVTFKPAQHHAVIAEKTGAADFLGRRPTRGAEGLGVADRSRAPHRPTESDDERQEAARPCDIGSALDAVRRIGVSGEQPPDEGGWGIDRNVDRHDSTKHKYISQARV